MNKNQWYALVPVAGYLLIYLFSLCVTAVQAAKREGHDPTANAKRASRIIHEDLDVRLHHLIVVFGNSIICMVVGYVIGRIQ